MDLRMKIDQTSRSRAGMITGPRMSPKDLVLSELEHFENTPGAPRSVLFSTRAAAHERRVPPRRVVPGGADALLDAHAARLGRRGRRAERVPRARLARARADLVLVPVVETHTSWSRETMFQRVTTDLWRERSRVPETSVTLRSGEANEPNGRRSLDEFRGLARPRPFTPVVGFHAAWDSASPTQSWHLPCHSRVPTGHASHPKPSREAAWPGGQLSHASAVRL